MASEEAEEERARSRRRLRAEQDAEYQAALLDDQVPSHFRIVLRSEGAGRVLYQKLQISLC